MSTVHGRKSFRDHFDNAIPVPFSGCLIWPGPLNHNGYGLTKYQGKQKLAHRVVMRELLCDGLNVLHKCDVRCCVNPSHLYIGTHIENMQDMKRRGRHIGTKGLTVRKPYEKLSDDQVIEIRANSKSSRKIAEMYGVSQTLISAIKRGTRRNKV